MTKMYTLKPAAQTMTPHSFRPNRHGRRVKAMTLAARQRNDKLSNTAATHYQYTINESQPKLPSTIILTPNPVFTLTKRTKKYITHLSSCGKNSNDKPPHKQHKTVHTLLLVGQDAPIAPSISLRTPPRTKQQKTAHTTLSMELADTITSPITAHAQSRTTTVPKKTRIEDQIQLVK